MISTLEDYKLVGGDIGDIIIDGDIMPLRTGNTANVDRNGDPIPRTHILRGEDVCFLLEALQTRLNDYISARAFKSDSTSSNYVDTDNPYFDASVWPFSRKINSTDLYEILNRMLSLCRVESSEDTAYFDIYTMSTAPVNAYKVDYLKSPWHGAYPSRIVFRDSLSAYPSFTVPSALRYSFTSGLFADLQRMNCIAFQLPNFYPAYVETGTVTYGTVPGSTAPQYWGVATIRTYLPSDSWAYQSYLVPTSRRIFRITHYNASNYAHHGTITVWLTLHISVDSDDSADGTVYTSVVNITDWCTFSVQYIWISLPQSTDFVKTLMSRNGISRPSAYLPSSASDDLYHVVSITPINVFICSTPSAAVTVS